MKLGKTQATAKLRIPAWNILNETHGRSFLPAKSEVVRSIPTYLVPIFGMGSSPGLLCGFLLLVLSSSFATIQKKMKIGHQSDLSEGGLANFPGRPSPLFPRPSTRCCRRQQVRLPAERLAAESC